MISKMQRLPKSHLLGVFLLAVTVWDQALSCTYKGSPLRGGEDTDQPTSQQCPFYSCGVCEQPIDVTLVFNNVYQKPHFHFNVTVVNKARRELIHVLERAADQDSRARFISQYWGSLGYSISVINKMEASSANKTYWKILEHESGNGLNLGVSHYVPIHNEVIQFNFTTYGSH